ncbi:transcriptional regulator [Proteus myxofaciens]|uniref:Phage repressor n=1 Tax=Proteus myxofaciens ATCC 19692 TaxID=1354337 RepID=A0A198FCD6_9GAMM|nr:YdaS family helix-turn-helix protein [Proteus myxofaciens]OAT22563.1 phage repressor [Proteus myxofaciens ATCC 19692]
MKNQAIEKAIRIVGSQQKLATLCGVSQPTVWRWLHGGGMDSKYVVKVVKATRNQVRAQDIYPELSELLAQ